MEAKAHWAKIRNVLFGKPQNPHTEERGRETAIETYFLNEDIEVKVQQDQPVMDRQKLLEACGKTVDNTGNV